MSCHKRIFFDSGAFKISAKKKVRMKVTNIQHENRKNFWTQIVVTGPSYTAEDLIWSSTWYKVKGPFQLLCVSRVTVLVCLLNNKSSQYVLYYKTTRKAKLSWSVTAWLRQRLLFELLCLSRDTSFIFLRSVSTPFVIVCLKGIGLPL